MTVSYRGFALVLFSLFLSLPLTSNGQAGSSVLLRGQGAHSSSPELLMVETPNTLYSLDRMKLDANVVSILETASLTSASVSVTVPGNAIVNAWSRENSSSNAAAAEMAPLPDRMLSRNGKLLIEGNAMFSFSDEQLLVKVNDSIYSLRKTRLSPEQQSEIKKGGKVRLTLALDAIDNAWTDSSPAEAAPAMAISQPERVVAESGGLRIEGRVLSPYGDSQATIGSRNTIFVINTGALAKQARNDLEVSGRWVDLLVPSKALTYAYPNPEAIEAESSKTLPLRTPASKE